eukprot:m.168120 g.168120  ORF g.168120 m.168120 type:complete len:1190 (+) comp15257_c0_seq2:75-3644(+)
MWNRFSWLLGLAILLKIEVFTGAWGQTSIAWSEQFSDIQLPSMSVNFAYTTAWMNSSVSNATTEQVFFVMGGWLGFYTPPLYETLSGATWLLRLSSLTWIKGSSPPLPNGQTIGSAATTVPGAGAHLVFVHGGYDRVTIRRELLTYNVNTDSWAIFATQNSPALYLHTLACLNNTLLAYGGFSNLTLTPNGNLYHIIPRLPNSNNNTSSNSSTNNTAIENTWSVVSVTQAPPPRAGHSVQVVGDTMYVLLGCARPEPFTVGAQWIHNIYNCPIVLQDVWAFSYTDSVFSSGVWTQLASLPVGGALPSAFDPVQRALVVFGATTTVLPSSTDDNIMTFTLAVNLSLTSNSTPWVLQPADTLFPAPVQRLMGSAVWDHNTSSIILFGGKYGLEVFDGSEMARVAVRCDSFLWVSLTLPTLPPSRLAASFVELQAGYVLFGGATSLAAGSTFNDVWLQVNSTWQAIAPANPPPARQGHFAGSVSSTQMIVFGGWGNGGLQFNDVWLLFTVGSSTAAWYWQQAPAQGTPPAPRIWSNGFMWQNTNMYIFGGLSNRSNLIPEVVLTPTTLDELFFFDVVTNTWTQVPRSSPWPPARYWATGQLVQNQFILYGGFGSTESVPPDLWVYNPVTQLWRIVPQSILTLGGAFSLLPLTIAALSTVLPGANKLVMVGGLVALDSYVLNYSFSTSIGEFLDDGTWQWTVFEPGNPQASFAHPLIANGDNITMLGFETNAIEELSVNMQAMQLTLACYPGYYSDNFSLSPCRPCPVASYTELFGSKECTACPTDTTTTGPGATSKIACNVCTSGYCERGVCHLSNDFNPSCVCPVGYGGATCNINVLGIALGVLFGSLFLTVLLFCVVRRVRRRLRGYQTDLTLAEKLLSSVSVELRALEQVMMIAAADVRLTRLVDAGSFGEVWLGEYQERTVAIKRLRATVQELDASAVADFDHEIKLLRRLRHRNIVFFYGAGLLDGGPFLVTEYMARGSLKAILHGSAAVLGWRRRLRALQDTAAGMHYLHSQTPPFIHRDLKSGNLLVTDTWTVKVCDLGTARVCGLVEGGPRAASSNAALDTMTCGVGTLLWTAPEVLQGRQYDIKADVYSFSIVMFEVLTRVLPYPTLNTTWAVRDAVEAGVRPEVPADCPSAYGLLMRRCWSTAPADRPAFGECLAGIEAMLAAAPADPEEMQETEAPTSSES